jgi:hypothetical protein
VSDGQQVSYPVRDVRIARSCGFLMAPVKQKVTVHHTSNENRFSSTDPAHDPSGSPSPEADTPTDTQA